MPSHNYRFTEAKYSKNNPENDLDFGNDGLYKELDGKDVNNYKTYKSVRTTKNKKRLETNKSNNKIYIIFILSIIALILFWYFYRSFSQEKTVRVIDTYQDQANLIMFSPDVGTGLRFGRY